ncbi:hypothetical protein EJ03DRAFT_159601 [Teratosphaeria nubilosa]|uniref:Glycosyltransferase family 8 protein n=1 Tax=Teratosphaeria nubilosa TaxID=161662 RepID=A0A6G1L3E6_9PEZI|nr:hypothetical protein EJ03DRAFT_159601 [Teratosphaeria nubilosa]
MGRLLLTQSQVTVICSTAVILAFTILLFLSGYVIQQRTVTSLQVALKPRIPQKPPSLQVQEARKDVEHPAIPASRIFGRKGKVAYTNLDAAQQASQDVDWQRLAHVQIARSHHDVCSAIMVLADLHRLKSPARRVLLFPRDWAFEKETKNRDEWRDPYLDTSRRLMRMAARRYEVELRPMSAISQTGSETDVYSLVSAFALSDMERVMSIEPPGLLLDATPLDAVLAFTESVPFAMLQDSHEGDGVHSQDLMLLQPDIQLHGQLLVRLGSETGCNDSALPSAFPDPLLLASTLPTSEDDSAQRTTLIRSIGSLHEADKHFNHTAFLEDVSYIRFSDPKLPGPEYDVPWADKVAARPKNKDADWVWTKMYGQFAQRRIEVCGLDLETWRRD